MSTDTATTTISGHIVRRRQGIAGQYAIDAVIDYTHDNGETESHAVTFVSSFYRAPVVLVSGKWELRVVDWQQYGEKLDNAWIARFYGGEYVTDTTFLATVGE